MNHRSRFLLILIALLLALPAATGSVSARSKLAKPFCAVNSMLHQNIARTNPVKHADGYIWYRADKKDGKYRKLGETRKLYYRDKTARQGKVYYYKLRAFRKTRSKRQYSGYSNAAKGVRLLAIPSLSRKAEADGIRTTWTRVTDADGYQLYRSSDQGQTYKKIYSGTKRTYLDKHVKKGHRYYYKVRAYRKRGTVTEYGYASPSKHSRNRLVAQAKSWLGLKESNGSFKKIINVYNSYQPLPRGIRCKYEEAWCTTFTTACAIKAKTVDIMPRERICRYLIPYYQELGQWIEKDAYVPKKGDLIFYDWDDKGRGDCHGDPDHIGIVAKVKGKKITVIEGNYRRKGVHGKKKDKVAYHTVRVNDPFIRGYASPGFDVNNGITF